MAQMLHSTFVYRDLVGGAPGQLLPRMPHCSGQQQGYRYLSQEQTQVPACRHGAVCILYAVVLHHPPSCPHHQGEQADVLCISLSSVLTAMQGSSCCFPPLDTSPAPVLQGHYVDQQIQAGSSAYTDLDKVGPPRSALFNWQHTMPCCWQYKPKSWRLMQCPSAQCGTACTGTQHLLLHSLPLISACQP